MRVPTSFRFLKQFDWVLFITVILIVTFGLLALYSISANQGSSGTNYFHRQLLFLAIGVVLFFLFAYFDYRFLASYARILYLIGGLILVVVLVLGKEIRGSTAWLEFFGHTFQPVELVKIIFIIFLSKYLADHYADLKQLKYVLWSGGLVMIFIVLLVAQPEMGYSLLLMLIWLGMLFFSGARVRHILLVILIIGLIVLFSWFLIFKDYQKDRILTFFNPQRDPLGQGYNLRQAMVAVGSGQIFGRGLSLGTQSQLHFLPAQHTDFIFAVVAEDLGLVGVVILLALFSILLIRIFQAVRKARDHFSLFLLIGLLLMVFIQVMMNVGMNVGILPVAGIPLPLVSYGGSSLIALLIILGIIESIVIRQKSSFT